MASTIGRNLHLCFPKIKCPTSPKSSSSSSPAPLTLEDDHNRPLPNSTSDHDKYTTTTTNTSSSIDLVKNFNSLYELNFDSTSNSKSLLTHSSEDHSSSESDADSPTPDFAAVFASHRFFFSSPGRSNSIIDSSAASSSSSPGDPPGCDALVRGSIAIPTYSPDPYKDFRRSMQEMVEARELMDVRANWDYLHELLLCYLALNPKSTHKFIVGAFADLLVSLMTSQQPAGGDRESDLAGGGSNHVI
ncbi:transcription repressor OFP12-like [Cornus florida]|uniref:transcription repressor OFP12-like n=1 Tax=Cornus florida TaxID=4283 RepID=UPI0028998F39|nr:transcription repressor OFP12-like [Cornus florida]